jgi:hypothetical protein
MVYKRVRQLADFVDAARVLDPGGKVAAGEAPGGQRHLL